MTRVVLADDHPLFLSALRVALESAGIEVLATAGSGLEVLECVAEHEPDAVLLDLDMPRMDGLTCLSQLRERFADVKVVIVSAHDDTSTINKALDAGALCFVGKKVEPEDLAHALRMVVKDTRNVYYSAGESSSDTPSTRTGSLESDPGLTKRELEILKLVAEGHSNSVLARSLWVTEQTVKFHLSNIYRKLEVGNRTAAAAKARSLGLLDERNEGDSVEAHSVP